jgi:hypothetical protein
MAFTSPVVGDAVSIVKDIQQSLNVRRDRAA